MKELLHLFIGKSFKEASVRFLKNQNTFMDNLFSFCRNAHLINPVIILVGKPSDISTLYQLLQGNGYRRCRNIEFLSQIHLGAAGISVQLH